MKIQFDTPLTGTDENGDTVTLTAAQIAALTYTVFLDTVNPPVKSYAVPAANLAAATTNANGSKHVTVDTITDLGVTEVAGTTYFAQVGDGTVSAVLSTVPTVSPVAVANFSFR